MLLRVQANNEEPSRLRLTSLPLNSRNKQSARWRRPAREAVINKEWSSEGSCLNHNQNKDSNDGQEQLSTSLVIGLKLGLINVKGMRGWRECEQRTAVCPDTFIRLLFSPSSIRQYCRNTAGTLHTDMRRVRLSVAAARSHHRGVK